ncbi:MAG: DUF4062 domain-containing protein, partial [Anaerolineae bacterium]|nr:DUF4062 domain-containing protein [Anaerolineae bacterium]
SSPDDAIAASLKMVDQADIYVGIYAHRYGYVPKGHDLSVTEMEYDHAGERGIPRLVYVMHEDHPVRAADVETGEGAAKLAAFKKRVLAEQVVNFFQSPADLRGQVLHGLVPHRESDVTKFHYVRDIPAPPEPYVAHPYTLLQTRELIGRRGELNLLTDWVARPGARVYGARILNLVAIGGMGKSALTWHWFNAIASLEMVPLAGRLWWSFYESDARYENFIPRALAYASGRPREEVEGLPLFEAEAQLLHLLDARPFLLVLDGLERILIAYARLDAAHLQDDDLDRETAHSVAGAWGLPESAAQSYTGQGRLRRTADPRAGAFLRKLARVSRSRVLVSTRLYPADLQAVNGAPWPGCAARFLPGLSDDDALALWRAFGVKGSRDALLPLFRTCESHPLLIQALAGEVARYRPAPGDYDEWRKANPGFDPFGLPLVQVKSHVLAYALRGLDEAQRKALHTAAGLRMAATYDTLAALLAGEGRAYPDERTLDEALCELEDRGLLGWDRRANRYDIHPIVRGVVWSGLGEGAREAIYETLHGHFEALPQVEDWHDVERLEDLTPAIELYHTLIGLERYDDAGHLFYERLQNATLYRLSASRQQAELLEALFPDGPEALPRLSSPAWQAYTLAVLATAYQFSGQPGRAAPLFRRHNDVREGEGDQSNLGAGLRNLSDALRLSGALRASEAAARRALGITREQGDRRKEAASLHWLGLILAARGIELDSATALDRSLQLALQAGAYEAYDYLAARALLFGCYDDAQDWADRAMAYGQRIRYERGMIRASRVQGEAALGLGELGRAGERLHHALTRARAVNLAEEELPALVVLAEFRRKQRDPAAARDLLDDVWEPAERGPYPLYHADALNLLAQIERDAGNAQEAIEAATRAYRLAWCDGPPYAYYWGLGQARAHLAALGAPVPDDLPPFEEANYEPMPEVEINPRDEYYVE